MRRMFTTWRVRNRKSCARILTPEDEIQHHGNGGGESETVAMALRFGGAGVGGLPQMAGASRALPTSGPPPSLMGRNASSPTIRPSARTKP